MAPLTFADTHNMIAFLSKSDASAGFNQMEDFLNAQVIHYALMVNPTIYVSCIKQFWATASIKNINDVVKFMVRNVHSPSKFLMYLQFLQVLVNNQVDDLSSHTTKYTSSTLTQKAAAEEEDEEDEVPTAPTPPSPTHEPLPPTHGPITIPQQAQPVPPSSPPQEQPTTNSASDMTLLHNLMET
nr:hypothetical protein [Tanacetum cinerariifolium]